MYAQVGDVETGAQTGMSVLQVVMAERFPGPGSLLPVKRGVQLWGGFSDVFLSSVTSLESRRSLARLPCPPAPTVCSEASLPAVGLSPTLKLPRVFSESPRLSLLPMVSWQKSLFATFPHLEH